LSLKALFVATAPIAADGLIKLFSEGMDTFRINGAREVVYLDLTGSGIETAAHLNENARIVFMFCAFYGPRKNCSFTRNGFLHYSEYEGVRSLWEAVPDDAGARGIVRAELNRISDSCGYSVPRYEYIEDRDTLLRWAENKGPERLAQYRNEKNAKSLDGLPGITSEN
jgi:hypothetical protein